MTRTLCTLAVVATLATPAAAEDTRVMLQGAGTAPCAKITDLYRRAPELKDQLDTMVSSWAAGFMTSGNLARRVQGKDSRDLGGTTMPQQTLALRRWCKAHPTKQLMDAVFALFATFPSNNDADIAEQENFK